MHDQVLAEKEKIQPQEKGINLKMTTVDKDMKNALLILHGEKIGTPNIRQAVYSLRKMGHSVHVRVTWEGGDIDRFVDEACNLNVERIIVGGGDGSLNEAVNALLAKHGNVPPLGILPLGTANDFATACAIPQTPLEALELALTAKPVAIDIIQANEQFFINVASMGFGAVVTANTPVDLKNFIGGGAYTLAGLVQALNFEPYKSRVTSPNKSLVKNILVAAVCNGRTAGGGQLLAPKALINDGLLDTFLISEFSMMDSPQVIQELQQSVPTTDSSNRFVRRFRVPWLETELDHSVPLNLDGEPYSASRIRFSVLPQAIRVLLPDDCPCLE